MLERSDRPAVMQLGVALSPALWLPILAVVALGGIAVHNAGPRGWWVAALLVVTNPSSASHDDALHQEVRGALRQEMDREAKGSGRIAVAALQYLGGDAAIDLLLDVDYQNFILFSRTTMDGELVSVGVLGQVFIQLEGPSPRGKRSRRQAQSLVTRIAGRDAPAFTPRAHRPSGGVEVGHLTPIPRSREAVRVVARNVARTRRHLPDVPLLLENIA